MWPQLLQSHHKPTTKIYTSYLSALEFSLLSRRCVARWSGILKCLLALPWRASHINYSCFISKPQCGKISRCYFSLQCPVGQRLFTAFRDFLVNSHNSLFVWTIESILEPTTKDFSFIVWCFKYLKYFLWSSLWFTNSFYFDKNPLFLYDDYYMPFTAYTLAA